MQLTLTFNDVLEAADQLTLAEQESLIDILNRRLAEKRRAKLVQEITAAREEYRQNRAEVTTADDMYDELLSRNALC